MERIERAQAATFVAANKYDNLLKCCMFNLKTTLVFLAYPIELKIILIGEDFQIRSNSDLVNSLLTSPVLSVLLGSINITCTSSRATGKCSTPLGIMTNSPGLR